MENIIEVKDVTKIYKGDFKALSNVSLSIKKGEIVALLGPNGAGKTTLISIICALVRLTKGQILIDKFDIETEPMSARKLIGLVPQELTTDMFETVWNTVSFSRGLFGLAPNPTHIEDVLKKLSLWDKKDNRLMTLSGGMKRRVMIAKALAHEPKILFLDEPTAGVDVELRKEMWSQVRKLRTSGVTIILTTHYIEEAEEMADRIGVICKGELIALEDKKILMKQLGKKQMKIELKESINDIPKNLSRFNLKKENGYLLYDYDSRDKDTQISDLFDILKTENITYKDIQTKESSLEEIFVQLVNNS